MTMDMKSGTFRLRAIAAAVGLASGAVHAVDPVVTNLNDSGAGSLRQAMLDAGDDGGAASIISFQEGLSGTIMLQSVLPAMYDAVNIQGAGIKVVGPNNTGGAAVFRFVSNTSYLTQTLTGLTITGAKNGAVWAYLNDNNSTLRLQDTVITRNTGSAVEVLRGELVVDRSVISGNQNTRGEQGGYGYGAGIRIFRGSLFLDESEVSDNEAGMRNGRGGGIDAYGSELSIHKSIIANNRAANGAGVYLNSEGPVSVEVRNSTLSGNVAMNGGGMNISAYAGGNVFVINSSIINNQALPDAFYEGGTAAGVRLTGGTYSEGTFRLENSVVEGNRAFSDGGLQLRAENIELIESLVRNNTATHRHGAFRIDASNLSILRSSITDNRAPVKAAGDIDPLAYSGSSFLIDSTTISGHSSNRGPVLDLRLGYEGNGVISSSTISGNSARDAVVDIKTFTYLSQPLTIQNSTFSGNRSTGHPVAIQMDNVSPQIVHATFVNNNAARVDGFSVTGQLGVVRTDVPVLSAQLTNSVFTSGNDVEVHLGGDRFDHYDGSIYGSDITANISSVVMTRNVAVNSGSIVNGLPIVADANLQPLGYRGGFTLVHEPNPDSLAVIDNGSEAARPEGRDQRGLSGNINFDSDLGAVEVVANTPPRLVTNLGKQINGVKGTEIDPVNVPALFVDDEGDTVSVVDVTGLPNGLNFDGTSISGTLLTSGTYYVTVVARDDNLRPLDTVEQFIVTIPDKKGGGGGVIPLGLLALFGFLARLRRNG